MIRWGREAGNARVGLTSIKRSAEVAEGTRVSSDLIWALAGFVVGLAITAPIVWRHRTEAIRGWKDALGVQPTTRAPRKPPERGADRHFWTLGKRRLAISIGLLATLGSAVVAVQTNDATLRLLNIIAGGLLFASTTILIFDPRQKRIGSRRPNQ
jgi:hypothetical protein